MDATTYQTPASVSSITLEELCDDMLRLVVNSLDYCSVATLALVSHTTHNAVRRSETRNTKCSIDSLSQSLGEGGYENLIIWWWTYTDKKLHLPTMLCAA